tara:strand:- start:2296 stop:2721 length:426 start_codon:yes stop_codon:yes gene_type:complete
VENNQLAAFQNQRRNLASDFSTRKANNTFARAQSRRDGSRSESDTRRRFKRNAPKVSQNYASRGLGNSGVYQRALQNYTGDYSRDLGRQIENRYSNDQQYSMNDAGYEAEYNRQIGQLDLDKARMIAETAQGITGLRPLMG